MGHFESSVSDLENVRSIRSLLTGSIGPAGKNAISDLNVVTRALAQAGLLDENAPQALTRDAIFKIIGDLQKSIASSVGDGADMPGRLVPGGITERAFRRAVAAGRFPLAHRALTRHSGPVEPRLVVTNGMQRARSRAMKRLKNDRKKFACSGAVLPDVTVETFGANRRLVDSFVRYGNVPGLDRLIADTVDRGGKQGFADIKDFFQALKAAAPDHAGRLVKSAANRLDGKAARRFRMILVGESPSEADF